VSSSCFFLLPDEAIQGNSVRPIFQVFDRNGNQVTFAHISLQKPATKTKNPVLLGDTIVRVKHQGRRLLLLVKDNVDLAFLSGKPVPELLRYGEQPLIQTAGGSADCEMLLFGTHMSTVLL
jgi:hypothetical protein